MLSQTGLRVCDYRAQTSMRPHVHEESCISIVVRGAFVERIGQSDRHYARGQVAYLPAGVAHSQAFGRHGARQIIFRPQPGWVDYLSDCKVRLSAAPCASSPTFGALGDRLLAELAHRDAFSAVASEGLVLEIIAAFGRSSTAAGQCARAPAWLCAVHDFVHEHALALPTMEQVARVAGRHEIHVAREFRRFFGVSVGAYARRLRVERAAALLRLPEPGIAAIAAECGFASHAHLCREFRARFGVSPSRYRREGR